MNPVRHAADERRSSATSEDNLIVAAFRQEFTPGCARAVPPRLPERIGPYRVLRQIGAGGMGVVYEAEQEKPIRRRVAVKVIKLGMDTRAVVARFEAERQALALMDHPYIARVFEAGSTEEGQPYFAMECVQGQRVTAYCDEQRLTTRERLALFVQICQAIQHAHQKGVIHRDIKPSNVLVSTQDGKATPRIIDFGVAKATDHRLTEKTLFTEAGQFIGTPEYMSPEQAGLGEQDIDTRTDVYSLGVLLYELLVGASPYGPSQFRNRSIAQIQRIIREEEPVRPSTRLAGPGPDSFHRAAQRRAAPPALRRQLRGELDWITMKALEKDRARRYSNPADLAADIERHLKHEPVVAGPPSKVYQVRKFVRRHRGLVLSMAAVFLVLIAGITTSTVFAVSERRAKDDARRQTYALRIAAAEAALSTHNVKLARQRLEAAPIEFRNWEWRYLEAACDGSLAILKGHTDHVLAMALDPSGRLVASRSADGTLRLWDLSSRAELACLSEPGGGRSAVVFSPDGNFLASASDKAVQLWNLSLDGTMDNRRVLRGHGGAVMSLAFSPDGRKLASGAMDDTVRLWESSTGAQVGVLELEGVEEHPWGNAANIFDVAFSPDGKHLAIASWCDKSVRLLELETGEELWRKAEHRGGVHSVAFSPDGRYVAAGSQDHGIYVWTLRGELWRILRGHTGPVRSVAFEPNSDALRLVSASDDATVRTWDVAANEQLQIMVGHEALVWSAKFTPDRRHIVSASGDATLRVWDAGVERDRQVLGLHRDEVLTLAFSPDGTRLAAGTSPADSTIRIWDVRTSELLAVLTDDTLAAVRAVAFSPDGRLLVSASDDGALRVWDARTGEKYVGLDEPLADVNCVAVSPDNTRLACVSDCSIGLWLVAVKEGTLFGRRLWSRREHTERVHAIAFSPDGTHLASGSNDRTVRLWDARSGECIAVLEGHEREVLSVAFSPDGTRLASGSVDRTARLWSVHTAEEIMLLRGSAAGVESVGFSPDGTRLVTGARLVHLWDARTGEELLRLSGHSERVFCVAFSPDGTRLASGAADWTVRLWDTVPYRVRYQERQAILDAIPEAERIADALRQEWSDPRLVAQRLREDASLSEPVRHATLNLVRRRATVRPEP